MSKWNIAARVGAWSVKHRRRAIFGWFAFVLVTAFVGMSLGTRTAQHEGNGESGRVSSFLLAHLPSSSTEAILIQARHGELAGETSYRAAVDQLTARVSRIPHVFDVVAPGAPGHGNSVAKDGRSALLTLQLAPAGDVNHVLAATAAVARANPSLRIGEFGDASSNQAVNSSVGRDFSRAEKLSIPLTLLILLVAFGALVAAGVPMLLGLSAVAATLGLVGVVSHLLPMDGSINSVVLLLGLAVGVDYSLFYLRREREERAGGASPAAAVQVAAATSGRAIVVSGLTVMISISGEFLAGSRVFTSFAIGTILVVAVAMVGSLTVLPALMGALGPKIERGRIPFLHRLRRADGSRMWALLLRGVTAHPRLATVLSAGALVALALPAIGMHIALPGAAAIPSNLPIVRTYDRMQAAFPGGSIPATVGVEARDVRTPEVQLGVRRLIARAAHTPGLLEPVTVQISHDRRAEAITIPLAGNGTDATSIRALARLRAIVPGTVGAARGVQDAGVTGDTAGTYDFDSTMKSRLPIVFAFVLGMAFLVLLFTFRSIVIPIQSIVLNLLSVGAAYGVLVLVFQDGHGHKLLGFKGTGPVVSWMPLFLFVMLFGLSMDYHVFILSRVREAFDRGLSARESVSVGVRTTAGVVTSAALVMVAVFSIFATLDSVIFKQVGVGLASAILIDATVIRGVLLPATLTLLGDRAWYLPSRLSWIPGRPARTDVPSAEALAVEGHALNREQGALAL